MTLRVYRILSLAFLALALVVQVASAASSESIHEDAADGSIDGSYTLAEMRAADGAVSNEQREYYGWDDVYGQYMRELAAARPTADRPTPSSVLDAGRNIGRSIKSKSPKVTGPGPENDAAAPEAGGKSFVSAARSDSSTTSVQPTVMTSSERDAVLDHDASGIPSLLWVFAGIPLLILFAVFWRARRGRGQRALRAD